MKKIGNKHKRTETNNNRKRISDAEKQGKQIRKRMAKGSPKGTQEKQQRVPSRTKGNSKGKVTLLSSFSLDGFMLSLSILGLALSGFGLGEQIQTINNYWVNQDLGVFIELNSWNPTEPLIRLIAMFSFGFIAGLCLLVIYKKTVELLEVRNQ